MIRFNYVLYKYLNEIKFNGSLLFVIYSAQIKDETANSSEACMKAASEFTNDEEIVGVIGGYYSACSISFQNLLNVQG